MNRALVALPLALLPALLPVQDEQGQDPPPPPPPDEVEDEPELRRDIFGRLRPRPEEDAALEGMWQLLSMDLEGYPKEGLHPHGYLLIADGFMSFQLHAYYDEDVLDDDPWEDGYQTIMAEYELIGGERMVCKTLIGSYLDEEDDILDYEPAGMTREFKLEREGRFLTLNWGNGDWMTFGPRLHSSTQLEDVFGRERGERSRRGPDIYGRERVRGEGDKSGGGEESGGGDGR